MAIGGGWWVSFLHVPIDYAVLTDSMHVLSDDADDDSTGDGKTFPRNPRADEMLARLASDIASAD